MTFSPAALRRTVFSSSGYTCSPPEAGWGRQARRAQSKIESNGAAAARLAFYGIARALNAAGFSARGIHGWRVLAHHSAGGSCPLAEGRWARSGEDSGVDLALEPPLGAPDVLLGRHHAAQPQEVRPGRVGLGLAAAAAARV